MCFIYVQGEYVRHIT